MAGIFGGQAVLITGGGSGLGRGLVDCFLAEDARIAVLEVDEEKVAQLRADVNPRQVVVVSGDVRNYEDNQRAVAACVDTFGGLDAFIQCAGITDWTPAFSLLPDGAIPDAFTEIMDVNVLGPVLGAKASIPALRQSGGSMVFTLSAAGFIPGGQGVIYTLSKSALVGLVRQLAYELAPAVRVNGVVPGAVKESRIHGPVALGEQDLYPEKAWPGMSEMVKKATPLQTYPAAADYGPAYLLLADRQRNQLATGSILFWDGGISLVGPGAVAMGALQHALHPAEA